MHMAGAFRLAMSRGDLLDDFFVGGMKEPCRLRFGRGRGGGHGNNVSSADCCRSCTTFGRWASRRGETHHSRLARRQHVHDIAASVTPCRFDAPCLNKYGLRTASSGYVSLRSHTLLQQQPDPSGTSASDKSRPAKALNQVTSESPSQGFATRVLDSCARNWLLLATLQFLPTTSSTLPAAPA